MSAMKTNMKRHGFKALLATQFLGALNDNAFKFIISVIAVDQFAHRPGGTLYLSLSGSALILPFLLFSTYAGWLADRFSKNKIIVITKIAELAVMGVGLWALIQGQIWFLLAVLFCMGMQSAFFSPSKYGILPEILKEGELSMGNGLIQMWTNIAIILGTALGGYLVHVTKPNVYQSAYVFMGISLIGILTSLGVTQVLSSGSERRFEFNFLKEVWDNVRQIKKDRAIFLSLIGLAYFGFLGALFQLNILLYAKKIMLINDFQTSQLLIFLALGIGAGGILAGKLSDHKIELGLVPLGSIGLTLFSILLGLKEASFAGVAVSLFFLGMAAGFYVVPLNAMVQSRSPVDQRGKILATCNFFSFSAMLMGSGAVYVFRDLLLLNAAQIFVLVGLITIFGTLYIVSLLPVALVRLLVWLLTHSFYQIKVIDHKYIPVQGGALLVSNHVSMIDALLIQASTHRPIRFLINRSIYAAMILHPLFRLAKAIPISSTDSEAQKEQSLSEARQAILDGELVCIFAEGQLTRTGNILKFKKGLERIMQGLENPIVPVHLDRVWGSIFSFEGRRYYFKIPKQIPYPVTVSFGPTMPASSTAFEVRQRVMELGAEAFPFRLAEKLTLPEMFWQEARRSLRKFCMADSTGQRLSFAQALIASVALRNSGLYVR